jgi:hypothetical protein
MEIVPYAIGIIGLIIAVYGVFKSYIDKSEIRLLLTTNMLYDCRDELEKALAENLRLRNRIEQLLMQQQPHRDDESGVHIINISGEADVDVGGDIAGGDKRVGGDSITEKKQKK